MPTTSFKKGHSSSKLDPSAHEKERPTSFGVNDDISQAQDTSEPKPLKHVRKPKRFLEQEDSISLAALIADAQEDRAIKRVNSKKLRTKGEPKSTIPGQKKPLSAKKLQLNEKKAAIAADRLRAKRKKSKPQKHEDVNTKHTPQSNSSPAVRPAKKRVSFA